MNHSFRSMEVGVRLFIPGKNRSIGENRSLAKGRRIEKRLEEWRGWAAPLISVMKFLPREERCQGWIIFGPVPTKVSSKQSAASLSSLVGGTLSLSPSYRPCHTSFYAHREMNAVERR